jgi:hypothetical protein
VAQLLQLADEAPLVGFGLVAAVEVVVAEFLVVAAMASRCQMMTSIVWPTAKMALVSPFLPKRRWSRRNWAAR